jgi:acyl-CoA dehydrogenase
MNAAIREHLAAKGLGLHNDLQDESPPSSATSRSSRRSTVTARRSRSVYIEGMITGKRHLSFALTEPNHGSDATWLETRAVREGDHWIINGRKRWNSQVGRAEANLVFARTGGKDGEAKGITAFIVPTNTPGHTIVMNHWTFNMPTDHSEVELKDVRVPNSAILHKEGEGLKIAMRFIHENRIRQAAASAGAARYCIAEAVKYAKSRVHLRRAAVETPGDPVPARRALRRMRDGAQLHLPHRVEDGPRRPRRLLRRGLDLQLQGQRPRLPGRRPAMQVHGGLGYSRHMPFEHIYRHHRRYKITEGSEEVQKRRIAHTLFGFGKARFVNAPAPSPRARFRSGGARSFLRRLPRPPVRALSIRPTEGGMSNPTYFVDADGWRAVLRKQPRMLLAKSAHAIDREFRVLSRAGRHGRAVPRSLALSRRCRPARHARST